jgi:hypothetical protein
MAKALKKNKSANQKPEQSPTTGMRYLTESELEELRMKSRESSRLAEEYYKKHPVKPI